MMPKTLSKWLLALESRICPHSDKAALSELRNAYAALESRITHRTLELAAANLGLAQEIERRKRAELAFQTQALTDPLTGLYNRRGFVTLATQLRKQACRDRQPFLVVLADLDGLKQINDTYGHIEGDQAVKATAAILLDTFRASDIIARFGGDEFAVAVVEDLNESERAPLLNRLQDNINTYNSRALKPYSLNLSVGTAEIDADDNQTLVCLIDQADKGLYEVKQQKKSRTSAVSRSFRESY